MLCERVKDSFSELGNIVDLPSLKYVVEPNASLPLIVFVAIAKELKYKIGKHANAASTVGLTSFGGKAVGGGSILGDDDDDNDDKKKSKKKKIKPLPFVSIKFGKIGKRQDPLHIGEACSNLYSFLLQNFEFRQLNSTVERIRFVLNLIWQRLTIIGNPALLLDLSALICGIKLMLIPMRLDILLVGGYKSKHENLHLDFQSALEFICSDVGTVLLKQAKKFVQKSLWQCIVESYQYYYYLHNDLHKLHGNAVPVDDVINLNPYADEPSDLFLSGRNLKKHQNSIVTMDKGISDENLVEQPIKATDFRGYTLSGNSFVNELEENIIGLFIDQPIFVQLMQQPPNSSVLNGKKKKLLII